MKVITMGEPQVIMSNPGSKHDYFAWPTVTRLQNGKIAVVASGFRRRHICPFGKTVISYSEDEGKTYTQPAPVIDTVLDDRDGGILPFGKSNVIVTSFNNTIGFQRSCAQDAYDMAYLDGVSAEEEAQALGATFRFSNDCGVTFGGLYKSPVSSPHGPVELKDGSLLWVGNPLRFVTRSAKDETEDCLEVYRIYPDGSSEYVSGIENIQAGDRKLFSYEPHAIVLKDGTILVHIRVEYPGENGAAYQTFTIYQTKSSDNGKTWSKPEQILPQLGGSPAHLFMHSSGVLISTYGYREAPYGVKVMFSKDNGENWEHGYDIYVNHVGPDLGYPSTVELNDGSMLTVFYAHPQENEPAVIMQQRWRLEE